MAMLGILPEGSIWTLYYARWKHNRKIYAFVLYGGLASDKVHALNLGARELNAVERARIFAIIRRLGGVPGARFLKGPYLYRIFKTFARREIRKCYRTYFRSGITRAALLNYGMYKEGELPIKAFVSMQYDKTLFAEAQRDLVVKMINSNQRAYDMAATKSMFAKPGAVDPKDVSDARKVK